ncbi:hypothetical protein RvY_02564 [Ramazzottius varieornatus]|uniref:Uncharacterized protein n=1 Tax=Ramazzottius varieornatus TaxID=947166 RepID=A0A1D1UNW7_RAMVA|nr:hypothetical protein RvY_02564 [Ramazzottius varieornatus]
MPLFSEFSSHVCRHSRTSHQGSFTYKGEGHALKIQIEESGFHTDFEIKTINVDELVEVDFRHGERFCRVICKSDCVKDTCGLTECPRLAVDCNHH